MIVSPDNRAIFGPHLRNRRGRPRVIDGPVVIRSVRLPEAVYDAICRTALRSDRSVDSVIRGALASYVDRTSVVSK